MKRRIHKGKASLHISAAADSDKVYGLLSLQAHSFLPMLNAPNIPSPWYHSYR